MKRLMFWLMAAVVLPMTATAQDVTDGYRPMVVEGRTWHYDYEERIVYFVNEQGERSKEETGDYIDIDVENKTGTVTLSFERDSVVNGKNCKVAVERFSDGRSRVAGYYYEENKEVYVFYPWEETDDREPYKLFDFSKKEKDTADVFTFDQPMKILVEDTLKVDGQAFRRFLFGDKNDEIIADRGWVEGIGSIIQGVQDNDYPVYTTCLCDEIFYTFTYCEYDATTIVTAKDMAVSAHPMGIVDLSDIPVRTRSAATYDLQGRRVTDTTMPGVYVRNGRKVVKR